MKKTMYDGSKWKAKVKGLIRAITEKGFRYMIYNKDAMTVAVMATAKNGTDLSKKVFSRGVSQCTTKATDEFCPAVGRYFALKRAFEAALRKKNDEAIISAISTPMGKRYECKSQYKVKLTQDEMRTMKRKFMPRKETVTA